MFDFTGQTAIVTGGTRGIGAAIARAFLQSGANVVAIYGSNDERARAFQGEDPATADRLETVKLDVADQGAVEGFFGKWEEADRKLEILVNNAGIRDDAILALMGRDSWQRVIDVNLGGCYNMCKSALRIFTPQRYGRIVNITSPSGKMGFPGQGNYAASKAGIVALTKSIAREVGRRKVTANCVSPGFVATEFIGDLPEEIVNEHRRSVPMQRFGEPEEVAHAVLFLATREASYITGAVVEVTGGL